MCVWGAGSEEEDWTLCGPLHSSCPPHQCSTDPPLPWLIRMGLLRPYCSFPAWIVPVWPSLSPFVPGLTRSCWLPGRNRPASHLSFLITGAAVCPSVRLLFEVMNGLWLNFHKISVMDQGTDDYILVIFPDSMRTFDLSKIKAKLSECFSS